MVTVTCSFHVPCSKQEAGCSTGPCLYVKSDKEVTSLSVHFCLSLVQNPLSPSVIPCFLTVAMVGGLAVCSTYDVQCAVSCTFQRRQSFTTVLQPTPSLQTVSCRYLPLVLIYNLWPSGFKTTANQSKIQLRCAVKCNGVNCVQVYTKYYIDTFFLLEIRPSRYRGTY